MTTAESFTISRTERLERLRGQLQGRPAKGAEGRVQPSRGTRLLYGVMLHGAARLQAGLELTDLEARLVEPMRGLFSDEEVCDFGRVYQEEAALRPQLFPDSLAKRPVEEGYASEDLARDLPLLRAEVAAQPNVSVVDLDAPTAEGQGGTLDSEEFMGGVDAYGHGATMVTASGHQATQSLVSMQAALRLHRFYTTSETDEWSGSDEIYWVTAAGADSDAMPQRYHSPTFGDVDKGETKYFADDTRLFYGSVSKVVVCHIQCWEEDHGPPSELQRTMERIAEKLHYVADELAEHAVGTELEATANFTLMLAGIAYFIAQIMAYIKDDLVGQRTLCFDRRALEAMAAQPGREYAWGFSTGSYVHGSRTLYMRGTAVPTSNNVTLLTSTPSGWSAPTLPWPGAKTPDAPALAMHDGRLYCAVRGMADQIYISKRDGGTWTGFSPLPYFRTRHAPALTSFNGRLYLAYTTTNSQARLLSCTNGSDWSAPLVLPGGSFSAPALAVRDGYLHYFRNLFMGLPVGDWSSNGTTWTNFQLLPGVRSYHAPALAAFQGTLHIAQRDRSNGYVVITSNPRNGGWGAPVRLAGTTPDAPALAVHGNKLHCAVRGGDNRTWLSVLNGTTWSAFQRTPHGTSLSAPALATANANANANELCLVYRAIES
ncbi:glycoside hydrolase [Streptomyces lydicus]|uniref:glycoside hydrolase n=1 Tax=Streptomyces lydicus TaxID=47763 RepID=UPI0010103E3B|nr:glycoside hydrolase [Streptomyces lydicus]MCZ1008415.1 glycoside hydrolase [Streptomyces lydicus]